MWTVCSSTGEKVMHVVSKYLDRLMMQPCSKKIVQSLNIDRLSAIKFMETSVVIMHEL